MSDEFTLKFRSRDSEQVREVKGDYLTMALVREAVLFSDDLVIVDWLGDFNPPADLRVLSGQEQEISDEEKEEFNRFFYDKEERQ